MMIQYHLDLERASLLVQFNHTPFIVRNVPFLNSFAMPLFVTSIFFLSLFYNAVCR
jgi:hypothetical protein